MKIGTREIEVDDRYKVFFPDAGITKGDVVDYYERIAETMLPHMAGRPVMMHRFPDGIEGGDFYHKDVPDHFPDWIPRVEIEKEGGVIHQLVCEEPATLVFLADQGTITPHVWLSRTDHIRRPDRLVFDLDPPEGGDFGDVRAGAKAIVALLRDLGVRPFVMTTGSSGLHVDVPLRPEEDFDTVRELAKDIAAEIERSDPERYTTAARKAKREGRLYLDVMRNSYAQTVVAPYSLRARPGAPAATPIDLDELDDADLDPRGWTLSNIFRRLAQKDDPWAGMDRHARSPSTLREAVEKAVGSA